MKTPIQSSLIFLLVLQCVSVMGKMRGKRMYFEKTLHHQKKRVKRSAEELAFQKDPHSFFRQAAIRRLDGDLGEVSTEDDPDKVSTLGRPFHIGNFYDARTGSLMVGHSPWKHETLQKTETSRVQSTKFYVKESESLEDDMKFLDMDPQLQAQYMNGQVQASGSAGFLREERKSNRVIRTVIKYKDICQFVTLKSGSLNSIDHPKSMRMMRQISTHVVTGMELGVRAVLIFERKLIEGENKVKAGQELYQQVKKISEANFTEHGQLNASAFVNMTETELSKIRNITVKFFADFLLENPPLDYWQALLLYHKLPNIIETARETPTSITAYMFPLKKIWEYAGIDTSNPDHVKIQDVPMDVKDQLTDLFMAIDDIQREIETIKDRPVTRFHTRIYDQLTIFADHLDIYETHMKAEMAPLVPLVIQGNVTAAAALQEIRDLLAANDKSPFSHNNLRKWIREKEEEVDVLMAKIDLPNRAMHDGAFSAVLNHPEATYTCALILKIGHYRDPYLEVLNEYLDTKKPEVFDYLGKSDALHWWDPADETQSAMFRKAADIQEWMRLEEKKAKRKFKVNVNFAVREVILKPNENPVVTLELYKDGKCIDRDFAIPEKPGKPKAIAKGRDWVRLSWDAPEKGGENVGAYEVEIMLPNTTVANNTKAYHESVVNSCGKFLCHWRTDFAADNDDNLIEDLEPGQEYRFRVIVYTKFHHATAVGRISDPIVTKHPRSVRAAGEL